MNKVLVIGGGAAGIMAAIAATQKGAKVTLLEKNEKLGKKIYITGKGRCNVTNAVDISEFFNNIVTNEKFLYSALYSFDNEALVAMLQEEGCPLKEERGARVFPVSDHASDVTNALSRKCKSLGVEVLLNKKVTDLICDGEGKCIGVKIAGEKNIYADKIIVATGGLSYPTTGSTGDGYKFARSLDMKVTELRPALVALKTEEKWVSKASGLSLKNVSVKLMDDKKCLYDGFGEMLFTHTGVSGPLCISASSYYGKHKSDNVRLLIDLKPALSLDALDKRILRDFEEFKNKNFSNSLGGLLPSSLIPIIVELSGIDGGKKVCEISKTERLNLVSLLKCIDLKIVGTNDFNEAIITQGGVAVKEINPSTMECKKIKNLYFAGEVLDIDALTGGFNLQLAFSTGHLAGVSAAEEGE